MDLLQLKIYTNFFFVFLDIGNYSKNVLSAAMTILNILFYFFYFFILFGNRNHVFNWNKSWLWILQIRSPSSWLQTKCVGDSAAYTHSLSSCLHWKYWSRPLVNRSRQTDSRCQKEGDLSFVLQSVVSLRGAGSDNVITSTSTLISHSVPNTTLATCRHRLYWQGLGFGWLLL